MSVRDRINLLRGWEFAVLFVLLAVGFFVTKFLIDRANYWGPGYLPSVTPPLEVQRMHTLAVRFRVAGWISALSTISLVFVWLGRKRA